MKRNFLFIALAGAFGVALLGSASRALATCTPPYTGTQLAAGNYAIRVLGGVQDVSGTGTGATTVDYPSPIGVGGIGVIASDGACDITGGEFILATGSTFTGPGTLAAYPTIQGFQGSLSGNIVASPGSYYYFDSNNSGELVLEDSASGQTFEFGIVMETGNAEFKGARLNAGNPVVIEGEKQAVVTTAQALGAKAIVFDGPGGGGEPGSTLGVGAGALNAQVEEELDPLTGATDYLGGGQTNFNINAGLICDSGAIDPTGCYPLTSGALSGDVHINVLSGPFTADGTQNSIAVFNGDYGFPLAGEGFTQSEVLWGSANQYGFDITTGSGTLLSQSPYSSASTAEIAKATAAGTVHIVPPTATLVTSTAIPAPSKNIVITNDSIEPFEYTNIALSGSLPDVTVTTSGCLVTGGDIAADTLGAGPQICTITVSNQNAYAVPPGFDNQCTPLGAASCTSSGHPYACCTGHLLGPTCVAAETGTLQIYGNTHATAGGTQTATGVTLPITCQ